MAETIQPLRSSEGLFVVISVYLAMISLPWKEGVICAWKHSAKQ
jgi:hypothetical protein